MAEVKIFDRYLFDSIKDKLGEGGFSTAYKAKDLHRNRIVVLKIYDKQGVNKYDIIHEIEKVENIHHPNLVRYYDAFYWEVKDFMGDTQKLQVGVLEYINGGQLSDYFRQGLPLSTFEKFIDDIMNGLHALHQEGIIHLDLKPENIFIQKNDTQLIAKIGDFGLSRLLNTGEIANTSTMSAITGTPDYIAPEQILKRKFGINGGISFNADIWALGVIVLKYFTGKSWIPSTSQAQVIEEIISQLDNGLNLNISQLPEKWQHFVRLCLEPYATKRVKTIPELKQKWNEAINVLPETTPHSEQISKENNDIHSQKTLVIPRKEKSDKKPKTDHKKVMWNLKMQASRWNIGNLIQKNKKQILYVLVALVVLWALKNWVYETYKAQQALKKIEAAGYDLNRNYLTYFAAKGEYSWVKTYLDAGLDPNTSAYYDESFKEKFNDAFDNDKYNIEHYKYPLIAACKFKNYDIAKLLLEKGADVNAKNDNGETALIIAAQNDHTEIVKLLLEKGAKYDPFYKTNDGFTYLMAFARCGLTNYCQELLNKGADVNAKKSNSGWTALMLAAYKGHTETVQLLLEKGADVNAKNFNDERTALIWAAGKGHTKIVKLLLENGADVNAKDIDGRTALMLAANNGHTKIVQILIENGADVNAKDRWGSTVLTYPAANGHTEIVQLLLEKGANVNAKDIINGWTALMEAAANGHTPTVKLLLKKGANVNAKKYDGSTALMLAADNGHTKIVKLLIEKGADVNAKNNYGLTAYDYAKNDEIRNLIRQYGGRSGEELR